MGLKMMDIPTEKLLIVILGGLFGWALGKLPPTWIYGVIAVAILLVLVVYAR